MLGFYRGLNPLIFLSGCDFLSDKVRHDFSMIILPDGSIELSKSARDCGCEGCLSGFRLYLKEMFTNH